MGMADSLAQIGHRGAMGHAPENTLVSFNFHRAAQIGRYQT